VGLHSPETLASGSSFLNVCSENRPGRGDRILLRWAREGKNSFCLVGVAASNRHRGSGRPLTPATPPDMRVRIGRFRGLRKAIEQPRKPERVEVGERKRDGQGRAVRHTPGAVRTTRRLCSEFLANPALA
jgi:hypothetical protein